MLPFPQDLVGIQGGLQGHGQVLLLELRCRSCSASLLAYFPPPPSLPHFLGKYQFHTLVFPVQCCVDRCLEVGCGSVAMVTSLLLRRLLPSSVATFKAPTLQYSIGSEFKLLKRPQAILTTELEETDKEPSLRVLGNFCHQQNYSLNQRKLQKPLIL